MKLSERLAALLCDATDRENQHVILTTGAVDEFIKLIESAEAVVDAWESRGRFPTNLPEALGFDAEYHRQLDDAILRLKGVTGP